MEKDNANERSGHLMVSDYRGPRPRATPEELQVHCRHLRPAWSSGFMPLRFASGNVGLRRPTHRVGRQRTCSSSGVARGRGRR